MSIDIKWGVKAAAVVAILVSAACSTSSTSPSSPSTSASTTTTVSTPAPTPTPTPAPAPVVATAKVLVTVNPNPVTFSGVPITDSPGCAGSPNTWFYNQVLTETGGAAVTFTSRVDSFDQRIVNNVTNLNLIVPAMGSVKVSSRWCSGSDVSHTAQSSFTGLDANGHIIKVDGPVVQMRSLH